MIVCLDLVLGGQRLERRDVQAVIGA